MSYYYDEDEVQSVRDSANIVDIVSEYVQLKRAGQNYKGLCPFHSEKTPSFVVSPEKNIFHCFGCGVGGDALSFLIKYNNMDFKQAVEELADRTNIKLNKKEIRSNNKDNRRKDENRKLYRLNRESAIYFYKNLKKDRKASIYLEKRGIDNNTIKRFGIGYASESWNGLIDHLTSKNYSIEDIEKLGLLSRSRDGNYQFDRFRGRIIFPIWDIKDRIIGFGGRLIVEQGKMPKYLNSPDSPVFIKGNNLYGLNKARDEIRKRREIILVEGYMDVIALSIHGINNAVASLGTALTREQVNLIKRYTDNIIISYDSDSAGKKAAIKASILIRESGLSPRIVRLDDGMDPDEFLTKYTTAKYKDRVKHSDHFMDFIISFYKEKYQIETIDGKLKFIEKSCEILSIIDSPVELDIYINRLSQEAEVSREAIEEEIEKIKKKNPVKEKSYARKENSDQNTIKKSSVKSTAEDDFLNLLLKKPIWIDVYRKTILPDRFKDEMNRKIYEALLNIEFEDATIAVDIDSFNADLVDKVKKIDQIELNIEDGKYEKAIDDLSRKLERDYLIMKREKIVKKLAELEKDESIRIEEKINLLNKLYIDLQEIDNDINRVKTQGGWLDA
ncbi:MAG: DNA primase [Andreesenia angusta]|nr:DNA primase [Andreesenia angusta]